jgi:hypothetical protein
MDLGEMDYKEREQNCLRVVSSGGVLYQGH